MGLSMDRDLSARITARRAEVLRELADSFSEPEIAEHLGLELNGVRSHVEQLRTIIGCSSVRELGRWWRANRDDWLESMREAGGTNGYLH